MRLTRNGFPRSCYIRNHSIRSITDNFSHQHFSPPIILHHSLPLLPQFMSLNKLESSWIVLLQDILNQKNQCKYFYPCLHPPCHISCFHASVMSIQVCLSREAILQSYYIRSYSAAIITANVFPSVLRITCCLSLFLALLPLNPGAFIKETFLDPAIVRPPLQPVSPPICSYQCFPPPS